MEREGDGLSIIAKQKQRTPEKICAARQTGTVDRRHCLYRFLYYNERANEDMVAKVKRLILSDSGQ